MQKLKQAAVSEVLIQRPADNAHIVIRCARPGIAIGRKGEDVEKLREQMADRLGVPVHISVEEIRRPDLESKLVAESIASQLEKRVMFRRAMKRAVQSAMKAGAKGIKVQVSGRLGGAEIARTEWYREGRVPLHTLRADVDYGVGRAETTYGSIGIKVWIYTGDMIPSAENLRARSMARLSLGTAQQDQGGNRNPSSSGNASDGESTS